MINVFFFKTKKMKKLLVILFSLVTFVGCNKNQCLISGKVNDENLNGKWIFLVPVFNSDSLGVDSVVIKNNKFQFECNKEYLADIRIDYHYRFNKENLLVITEPGEVKVVIDSVSCGNGTPQNDSLQFWKELIMKKNIDLENYQRDFLFYKDRGDTLMAEISRRNMEIINAQFYKRTKALAENMKSGTLYDFLIQRIPKD